MRRGDLFAAIQPVNCAGGGGKQGNVAEKMGRDHVAFDIKRGNSRHGASVFRICVGWGDDVDPGGRHGSKAFPAKAEPLLRSDDS